MIGTEFKQFVESIMDKLEDKGIEIVNIALERIEEKNDVRLKVITPDNEINIEIPNKFKEVLLELFEIGDEDI